MVLGCIRFRPSIRLQFTSYINCVVGDLMTNVDPSASKVSYYISSVSSLWFSMQEGINSALDLWVETISHPKPYSFRTALSFMGGLNYNKLFCNYQLSSSSFKPSGLLRASMNAKCPQLYWSRNGYHVEGGDFHRFPKVIIQMRRRDHSNPLKSKHLARWLPQNICFWWEIMMFGDVLEL